MQTTAMQQSGLLARPTGRSVQQPFRSLPSPQHVFQSAPKTSRSGPSSVTVQALFPGISFKGGAKGGAKGRSSVSSLVDSILELATGTDGGATASEDVKQQIEELAVKLERYCVRQPSRSPLLFGEYDVLYSSKPEALGGPLRSGVGRATLKGQRLRQILREPNVIVNDVAYKALGFLPGNARQNGTFEAISADTFTINFDGGKKDRTPDRIIKVVYLDDRVRLQRSVPRDEDSGPGALFVFERVASSTQAEDEADDGSDDKAPAPSQPARRGGLFGGTKKITRGKAMAAEEEEEEEPAALSRPGGLFGTRKVTRRPAAAAQPAEEEQPQRKQSPGLGGLFGTRVLGGQREGYATKVERAVRQAAPPAAPQPKASPAVPKQKSPQEAAKERAAAAAASKAAAEAKRQVAVREREQAQARAQAEREKAAKEREAALRQAEAERARIAEEREAERQRIVAERQAAAEERERERQAEVALRAQIKAQLDEIAQAASEAQAEAKEAAAEVKNKERGISAALREAASARSQIEAASAEVADANEELKAAQDEEKEAAKKLEAAKKAVRDLELQLR